MVEWYQNRLCIHGGWLYQESKIITKICYDNYTRRKHLQVVRKACRNTPALIDFESMPDKLKASIIDKVGNPYDLAKENQLIKHIHHDPKAVNFYKSHLISTEPERRLPEEAQLEYYNNAIIMNALHIVFTDRKSRRRALGGNTNKIWENLSESVNNLDKTRYPNSLPGNYRRLKEKYSKYQKEGYIVFVHKGYCNQNSEKLNDEVKLWLLSKWANNIERIVSVEHLLEVYNDYALSQRESDVNLSEIWKEIKSVSTLQNFLNSDGIKVLWESARYGELKSKEKFMYQHSTLMPTMRDSLWYSDGTKLNYYYQDDNGKIGTISVYEVMDTFSEVLVGYAFCKNEDFKAQKEAYKRAFEFSRHKPFEIKFDNQGGHRKQDAQDFFSSLARVAVKTKPYNGKSKTIESAFGRLQKRHLRKDWFFTGQNITASSKESRANQEFILANKVNLPSLEEVKEIYLKRRDEWNTAQHPKYKKSRMDLYQESVNAQTVEISDHDMIELFCEEHPNPVRVTAYGIRFTKDKRDYNFMLYNDNLPDIQWIADHIDKKYIIKYDLNDMNKIYLFDKTNRGLSFVATAEEKIVIHRGLQEQEDWEAEYIKSVDSKISEVRTNSRDKLESILKDHYLLPEQHGLNSPRLKGLETSISSRKRPEIIKQKVRKTLTKDIAGFQKDLSNKIELINSDDELDALIDNRNADTSEESISIYERM